MTQKEKEREEAREHLRELLSPGDTLWTVLRHVSKSGMTRDIDVYLLTCDNGKADRLWLSSWVARALDYPFNHKHEAVRVSGCGMDMGFSIVYQLGRRLFPEGFIPAEAGHRFGRNGAPATNHDPNGGYALTHKWL